MRRGLNFWWIPMVLDRASPVEKEDCDEGMGKKKKKIKEMKKKEK